MTAFIGDIRFNRPIAAGDVHVAIGRPADWRDSGALGDLEFDPDELREAAALLPRPLAEASIDAGVALNVLHWRGLAGVS